MKTLIISFIVFIMSMSTAVSKADTITVNVNGMVCAFCAQGIEKKLRELPETKDVYVSLESKIVIVELKDKQLISDDAIKALIKEAGYDVTNINASTQTLDQVKALMQKNKP